MSSQNRIINIGQICRIIDFVPLRRFKCVFLKYLYTVHNSTLYHTQSSLKSIYNTTLRSGQLLFKLIILFVLHYFYTIY